MKKSLLLVALLAVPPVVSLLPGCGGGSGNLFKPNQPTAIPSTLIDLGQGQTAAVNISRTGKQISGAITIANLPQTLIAAKGAKATSVVIPVGTYNVSGTVEDDGSFRIGGTFPQPLGAFFFDISLPTQTSTGRYSLTLNGQTTNGSIPALSGPQLTPQSTPQSTSQPTTGVSRLKIKDFTKNSAFNGFGINAGVTITGQTPTFTNATNFSASNIRIGGDNSFLFEGPNLNRAARVGDRFTLGNRSAATGILYYQEPGNKNWESTSGTLEVTAVTPKTVTFQLFQVAFAPQSFGTTSAVGTFSINSDGFFSGS